MLDQSREELAGAQGLINGKMYLPVKMQLFQTQQKGRCVSLHCLEGLCQLLEYFRVCLNGINLYKYGSQFILNCGTSC